jgi:predicted nuclease with TOPRIM domain
MLMPSFNELLDAFNEAERLRARLAETESLRARLAETERKLANVQSHYSRLKRMYATLKGKTKNPAKMKTHIINLLESGMDDLHAVAERVGCTYGYAKNVSMGYRRLTENGR